MCIRKSQKGGWLNIVGRTRGGTRVVSAVFSRDPHPTSNRIIAAITLMLITLPKENTEITLVLGTILKENTLNWLSSQLGALSSIGRTPLKNWRMVEGCLLMRKTVMNCDARGRWLEDCGLICGGIRAVCYSSRRYCSHGGGWERGS
jgi:hypothetical protein